MTAFRQNSPEGETLPKVSDASVISVAREGNCLGCGTCEAACPTGALRVERNMSRGVYEPVLDETACTGCGLCLEVCPGRAVPIDALGKRFLDADQQHELFGHYRDLQLGFADDEQIRYQGASGGLVTALLLYALEQGLIDGAVVLGFEKDAPLRTQPLVARTREEIIAASGSKYCPAAVNRALREIRERPGTYAVVGLPCQVHALRKWQARDARMRERIRFVFGLFCANENTYLGTEFFLRCHRIQPAAVRSIRYRAYGWPGEIEVRTDRQVHRFRRGTTEPSARKRALLVSAFHRDFMIPRCMVCPDQTCELADVAFADPHLPEMRARYRDGISWCIVRTSAAAELIQAAVAAGRIHLEAFSERQASRAQNFKYKADVAGRMVRWQAQGRPVPVFGRDYVANRRMIREARLYQWSFHSHHRWTWPVIWLICTCIRGPMVGLRKGLGNARHLLMRFIRWTGQA